MFWSRKFRHCFSLEALNHESKYESLENSCWTHIRIQQNIRNLGQKLPLILSFVNFCLHFFLIINPLSVLKQSPGTCAHTVVQVCFGRPKRSVHVYKSVWILVRGSERQQCISGLCVCVVSSWQNLVLLY